MTCAWRDVAFIHFDVDPKWLSREVPFKLDLCEDRAVVSLVAFWMHGFRPRRGGALTSWTTWPIANYPLLNLRTYVRVDGEPAIYFLREWVTNRLGAYLGPRTFGLPYHLARIQYRHHGVMWQGRVALPGGEHAFGYRLHPERPLVDAAPPDESSPDRMLVEQYRAATVLRNGERRTFTIDHDPWRVVPADVTLIDSAMIVEPWPAWMRAATLRGAHMSPGLERVDINWPSRLVETS